MWVELVLMETPNIHFDKGIVNLWYRELTDPYQLTFRFPESCGNSKIDILSELNQVLIKHSGEHCEEGANFSLNINDHLDACIYIEKGALSIRQPTKTLPKLYKLNIRVLIGAIYDFSESGYDMNIKKINNFNGTEASYINKEKKNLPCLSIELKAGAVRL